MVGLLLFSTALLGRMTLLRWRAHARVAKQSASCESILASVLSSLCVVPLPVSNVQGGTLCRKPPTALSNSCELVLPFTGEGHGLPGLAESVSRGGQNHGQSSHAILAARLYRLVGPATQRPRQKWLDETEVCWASSRGWGRSFCSIASPGPPYLSDGQASHPPPTHPALCLWTTDVKRTQLTDD